MTYDYDKILALIEQLLELLVKFFPEIAFLVIAGLAFWYGWVMHSLTKEKGK